MATNQVLALMLIFCFSCAIAKNWRKVLVFLGALAMTVFCFGVYSIVETVRGDLHPTGAQIGTEATAERTVALTEWLERDSDI